MANPEFKAGDPCWADVGLNDVAAAKAFYGELFGWTFEDGDQAKYGGYVTALKDGHAVAGLMAKQPGHEHLASAWGVYLKSEDASATVQAAVDAGATVYLEPMDVPDMGRMALIEDPGGAAVGIWEPLEHKGYGNIYAPGTPAWHELNTTGYESALDFYTKAFGWEVVPMEAGPGESPGEGSDTTNEARHFRYATFGAGDDATAGVFDAAGVLPEGVPSHWQIYFAVRDTDAAAAEVERLGGSVIRPASDDPFGRHALVADPEGAVFLLHQDLSTH